MALPAPHHGGEEQGSAKFAFSLLYKEREMMEKVMVEQRKKQEKQEKDEVLQKFRQEVLAANKQPTIEDSIHRTMIADGNDKKQSEALEQENKGMFGTMMKWMRAQTGQKDMKDKKTHEKSKKKRKSSSSSSSASSRKPRKKSRSHKATSSEDKDKSKESHNKPRRSSQGREPAISSKKPEEVESDNAAPPVSLPLKIPRKSSTPQSPPRSG
jgi:hypothetical protein